MKCLKSLEEVAIEDASLAPVSAKTFGKTIDRTVFLEHNK